MALDQGVMAGKPIAVAAVSARKPGGVLIFVPLLIAFLGAGALVLGNLPAASSHQESSGYGIDEVTTGSILPPAGNPIVKLDD